MNTPENPAALTVGPRPGRAAVPPARPHPMGTAATSITPADIWRIFRRRQWLIIITAVCIMIPGAILNVLWDRYWPSWPASALLEVQSPLVQEAMAIRTLPGPNMIELFAHSEANAIRSRQYAQLVLQDTEVRETEWYKRNNEKGRALIAFEDTLGVTPIRDTALIRVTFHTRNKNEAPIIVNALVERVYLPKRLDRATGDLNRQLIALRARKAKTKNELEDESYQINAFIEEKKIPILRGRQTDVEGELNELTRYYSQIRMANESAKVALENISTQSPESWIPTGDEQTRMDTDPNIQGLEQLLQSLEQERETQSNRLGPNHLFIKRLEERIRVTTRDLQMETSKLRQQVFAETLQGIRNAVSSNQATLEQIQNRIDQLQDKLDQMTLKMLAYQQMKAGSDNTAKSLQLLEDRIRRTQATIEQQKETRGTQVVLIAPALTSPQKSSPRLNTNLIATFMLSIIGGCGLAFLLEFLDKSLRSSQDIRQHTNLPFLGSIPVLEEDEANPQDMYSVVTHAPRSLLAEAFRQIRTNIMFSCSTKNCRSMLITSPSPEDGRTCIAVNLAASMALSGMKILLIDANFRKPVLHRLFPQLPNEGLAELIAGKISAEQTIVQTDTPGLWIMGNGQPQSHHATPLGSSTLGTLIEKLSGQFDQVILDGPPALLSADAMAISGNVDGIVFVARAGKNSRGELNRIREEISRLNSYIHGVVLNAVEAIGGGYLRKRYRLFYDYQHQPEPLQVGARTEPPASQTQEDLNPPQNSDQ